MRTLLYFYIAFNMQIHSTVEHSAYHFERPPAHVLEHMKHVFQNFFLCTVEMGPNCSNSDKAHAVPKHCVI